MNLDLLGVFHVMIIGKPQLSSHSLLGLSLDRACLIQRPVVSPPFWKPFHPRSLLVCTKTSGHARLCFVHCPQLQGSTCSGCCLWISLCTNVSILRRPTCLWNVFEFCYSSHLCAECHWFDLCTWIECSVLGVVLKVSKCVWAGHDSVFHVLLPWSQYLLFVGWDTAG